MALSLWHAALFFSGVQSPTAASAEIYQVRSPRKTEGYPHLLQSNEGNYEGSERKGAGRCTWEEIREFLEDLYFAEGIWIAFRGIRQRASNERAVGGSISLQPNPENRHAR